MRFSNLILLTALILGISLMSVEETSWLAPFLILPALTFLVGSLRWRPGMILSFLISIGILSSCYALLRVSPILPPLILGGVGVILYVFGEPLELRLESIRPSEALLVAFILVVGGLSIYATLRHERGYLEMYFDSPPELVEAGKNATVRVVVVSHFSENREITMQAFLDGKLVASRSLKLEPGEEEHIQISLGPMGEGEHKLEVVALDGKLRLSLRLMVVP